MQGDFSILKFDPEEHRRGVEPSPLGVLRNLSGVLNQQGRVMSDADLTEGALLTLGWQGQAARDIIGADELTDDTLDELGTWLLGADDAFARFVERRQ